MLKVNILEALVSRGKKPIPYGMPGPLDESQEIQVKKGRKKKPRSLKRGEHESSRRRKRGVDRGGGNVTIGKSPEDDVKWARGQG